jgi:nucleoside-diphosphate-sugar epimerase
MRVLFIGGTGTISASAVRLAVAQGMQVFVLNRALNSKARALPDSVVWLKGDVENPASVLEAIGELHFDAVVNFLSFTSDDVAQSVKIFRGRTSHYVHISSASIYHKPILQVPIVESTLRQNAFVAYSRRKIEAEDALMNAYLDEGFPATIVRPSHTYDDVNPPLPGGWTVFDRIERGAEIVVHGDGTSLWTLTHADDFARGLVGLLDNPRAVGEAFHITSNDVYTWDQIYSLVGQAMGVKAKLVHVPSEFFPLAAPEWGWSELVLGDLGHSAIFDNSKIIRHVPDFRPERTFVRSVAAMATWRNEHRAEAVGDQGAEVFIERLLEGYRASRTIFETLGATDA